MCIVVVLDINGVLGIVTKVRMFNKTPDAVLPSKQYFYQRDYVEATFKSISDAIGHNGRIVIWTSRLRKNAEPIERLLPHKYISAYFHGEDCPTNIGFHPIKNAKNLRYKLGIPESDHIIFVDDSPKYIMGDDNSSIVAVETCNESLDRLNIDTILKHIENVRGSNILC